MKCDVLEKYAKVRKLGNQKEDIVWFTGKIIQTLDMESSIAPAYIMWPASIQQPLSISPSLTVLLIGFQLWNILTCYQAVSEQFCSFVKK